MSIQLYNTLTRRKELFEPIDPADVRIYVCGPTVYNYAHIGNARPVVVFDVLFRLLRRLYGEDHVIYARNVTDVDDKINAGRRRGAWRSRITAAVRRRSTTPTWPRWARCPRPSSRGPPPIVGEIVAMIETAGANGASLRRRGPCAVRHLHARLRRARPALPGRHDRRRPGRGGALQEASGRLRAVEAAKPGEPGWASPWGLGGRAGTSNARR